MGIANLLILASLTAIPSRSPINGLLSSEYGIRISPFTQQEAFHQGIDIVAPLETPIYAPANGIVVCICKNKRLGNFVIIDHGNGITSKYGHVMKILVKYGQPIAMGSQIASVGMTGRTTGSHLHYEILVNGKNVDPRKFIF